MSEEQGAAGGDAPAVRVAVCEYQCLDGRPCGKAATAKDGRCEEHTGVHGRRSESGVAPTTAARKARRPVQYGKMLPQHLQPAYQRIVKSRDLTTLHSDIALNQVRIDILVKRLDNGEHSKTLIQMRAMWNELESALRNNDEDAISQWMKAIKSSIHARASEELTWRDIAEVQAFKAKLVDQENKRHYLMGATATAEQVRYLVECIMTAVLDNVRDNETRRKIYHDIRALQIFDWETAPPFDPKVFTE